MATNGATITMSMREVDRLKTVQAVVDGTLRVGVAAQRLALSRRQLERLLQRYKAQGAVGLLSRKRGRPSNHQLPAGLADRALALIRQHYADFGPTLAAEKLRERHGVVLGKGTPAPQPPLLLGRARADRRLRARMVRGPRAAVHAAGVC